MRKRKQENAPEKKAIKVKGDKTKETVKKREIETYQLECNNLNGNVEKESFEKQVYSTNDTGEHIELNYKTQNHICDNDVRQKSKRKEKEKGDNDNSSCGKRTYRRKYSDKKTHNRKIEEEKENKTDEGNEKRDKERNETGNKEEIEKRYEERNEKRFENRDEVGDEEEDEEDEEEDEDEDEEEEEIDELKHFGIALELPKRKNRGKNMKKLMGEDLEKDQLFWNHDTWEEEEHDSEYVNSEGEEEYKDITDSDFDISEDESENEENYFDNEAEEEKKKKKQMMNSYLEKLKKRKKKDDEIRFRHLKKRKLSIPNAENKKQKPSTQTGDANNEVGESTTKRGRGRGRKQPVVDADCLVLSRSKRDTTKQKTEEVKRLAELRRIKREKRHQKYCENKLKKLSSQKKMTRQERLEEVKITEQYNMESLIQLQAWEERKKRYQEYKKMMQYNTTRVFVSFGYNINKTIPTVNTNKYYPYVYWEQDSALNDLPNLGGPQETLNNKLENQEIVANDANKVDVEGKKEMSEKSKREEQLANEVKQGTCGDEVVNNGYVCTQMEDINNIKKENLEEKKKEEIRNEDTTKEDTTELKEEKNKFHESSKTGSDGEENQKGEHDMVVDANIGDLEVTEKQMYIFRNENELYMYSNYNDHKERLENVKNKKNICAICKLEGKYLDPLTKSYYHNTECFKVLRYLYFKKKYEEKAKGNVKKKKPLTIPEKTDDKQLPKVKKRKKRTRRKFHKEKEIK